MKVRHKHPHDLFFKEVNPIIKLLIVSDVLVVGAAGMFAPLYALFVEDFIIGGTALVVSISMSLYLISRSLLQIPVATLIDKVKGERDDFFLMFVFSIIASLIPLSFLYIHLPIHLYAIQVLLGITTAITYPSYMAIFTRHIDSHLEGTEWGIYYTLTDLGGAALAAIGGAIAEKMGFQTLILVFVGISLFGALILAPIKYYLKR